MYEYSFIYRDSPLSLRTSTAKYGVYIAELAAHLRAARDGTSGTVYRHNVAHDGSISYILSILQVDVMVWPGMGSEIVFELYQLTDPERAAFWAMLNGVDRRDGKWLVRILWGGQVLVSSNPEIGKAYALPLSRLLAYFDGLVGEGAGLVKGLCGLEG